MTDLKTRARILVLVILAALPALLFTVYSAIERRASEERQARAELRRLVKLAAMQQWQVVEGARQMMVASSQILLTLLEDRKRCTQYFASLLAQNREIYHSMGPVSGKRRATLQRRHLVGQGLWRRPAVLQARQGNGAIRDR